MRASTPSGRPTEPYLRRLASSGLANATDAALGQPHGLDDGRCRSASSKARAARRAAARRPTWRSGSRGRRLACAARQVRTVEQVGDDRRHDVEPGRPVTLDQRPPLRGAEAVRHDDAAAGHHRAYRRDALAVDVIQRQRARARGRRRSAPAPPTTAPAGVDHVPVRQQHALRLAGRARGVHEHRRRVRSRRRVSAAPASPASARRSGSVVAHDRRALRALQQRAQARDVLGRRKHEPRARMGQHVFELRGLRRAD